MADEFMKGLAGFIVGGLGWMVIAGWYNTPGFEEVQLVGPDPAPSTLNFLDQMALILRDGLLVFALASVVVFWILIPAYREFQSYRAEQS